MNLEGRWWEKWLVIERMMGDNISQTLNPASASYLSCATPDPLSYGFHFLSLKFLR
jgi:hypothetical protein